MKKKIQKSLGILIIPLLLINFSFYQTKKNDSNQQNLANNYKALGTSYTIEQIELGTSPTKNYGGAIVNNGTNDVLYMWGNNDYGQLGTGNTTTQIKPIAIDANGDGTVGNETQLSNLTLGDSHSGVLVKNGSTGKNELFAWGRNDLGQLARGTYTNYETKAKIIQDPNGPAKAVTDITDVNFYNDTSIAIGVNGGNEEIYSWGNNDSGQLGIGIETAAMNIPKQITFTDETGPITAFTNNGTNELVYFGDTNHLYGWGSNSVGQIGNGTSGNKYISPNLITLPSEITTISQLNGDNNSSGFIATTVSGETIYMSGDNHSGQLGNGTVGGSSSTFTEVTLPTNTGILELNCRFENSSSALVSTASGNELVVWGDNSWGQLGLGADLNDKGTATIVDTTSLTGANGSISDLATGGSSLLIIIDDSLNTVAYGTGRNNNNELAIKNGNTSYSNLTLSQVQSYNPNFDNNDESSLVANNITNSSVDIQYNFKMNGAIPSKVELFENTNSIAVNNTPTVNNDYLIGTFSINGLSANTDYTYRMEITYTRPTIETEFVGTTTVNFKTGNESTDIVYPTVAATLTETTTTEATFNLLINGGNDSTNTPWTTDNNFKIYDEADNEYLSFTYTDVTTTLVITNLNPNTNYEGWTIKSTWTSTTDGSYILTTQIPAFETKADNVILPTTGTITLDTSAVTETEVGFLISLNYGNTSFGNEWDIKNYTVYDEDNNPWPSENVVPGILRQSFVITNLAPKTTYQNWTLEINWVSDEPTDDGDGTYTTTTALPEFTTEAYTIINPTLNVSLQSITAIDATFTVTSDPGRTTLGTAWDFSSYKVFNTIDVNGTPTEVEITDEVIDNGESYTVTNLIGSTTYDNLRVETIWTSPGETDLKVSTDVTSFTTATPTVANPTWTTKFVKSSKTTATFNIEFSNGIAPSGYEWTIVDYTIKDDRNNLMNSQVTQNSNGSYTIHNLEPGADYSGWKLKINWVDSHGTSTYNATTTLQDFSTIGKGRGIYIIVAIILILIFLLVAAFMVFI